MKKILLLSILFFAYNAKGQVLIKFNNQTDKLIQLKITTGESTSPIESFVEVYSQTIPANYISTDYVKVKDIRKKKKIYVSGTIAGLGNFKFDERVIVERNQKIEINLNLTLNSLPSDNLSYQELINQLNYNPPKGSAKILSAEVAYKSFFGGLSLRKDTLEVDRIEPPVLKAEVTPIQYGSINKTIEAYFSSNFISDNKGAVPGIASVNLSVAKDELYKLKYTLNDIGTQIWSGPNGKSVNTLFSEMSETDKTALIKRYLADTTLQLFQYDQMYLFKTLTLSVEKYKRTSTTIDANVPVFFSSGTAYKREDGYNFTTNAYSTVLNIWATKNVTYLLVQAAQDYLEKQKLLVNSSTTTKDAQNLIKAAQLIQDENLLLLNKNMNKLQIERELGNKIKVLNDKKIELQANIN